MTAPKRAAPLIWTEAATAVLQSIKDALAYASLVVHPQPDALTCILTDAPPAQLWVQSSSSRLTTCGAPCVLLPEADFHPAEVQHL